MSVESESSQVQYVVVGVGVNVNEKDGLSRRNSRVAASLYAETGSVFSGARRSRRRSSVSWTACAPPGRTQRTPIWRHTARAISRSAGRCSSGKGERVLSGIAVAINDDFSLAVQYKDGGRENLTGGEIQVRGLYGDAEI